MKLIIHTDGGSRGNPGPAAVGVVIEETSDKGQEAGTKQMTKKIAEFGKVIGEATNNIAEYMAVIEALKELRTQIPKLNVKEDKQQLHIQFFLDSTLVVNQLNGLFKVKDARLRELLAAVRVLEQEIGGEIRYQAVPRAQNTRADFLLNNALNKNPLPHVLCRSHSMRGNCSR